VQRVQFERRYRAIGGVHSRMPHAIIISLGLHGDPEAHPDLHYTYPLLTPKEPHKCTPIPAGFDSCSRW
jgi:hypothetical protein